MSSTVFSKAAAATGLSVADRLFWPLAKSRRAMAVAVILLLGSFSYANSLFNGFAYDDVAIVQKNDQIRRLDQIPGLFISEYWEVMQDPDERFQGTLGLYRPLVLVTFALNYAAGGLNPFGYHLINVILHLGISWLVYVFAVWLRASPLAALIAAGIFAVHPIHTEAVAGIVGRAELLMTLGVVGGLWFAIHDRKLLSLLAFAGGLFSKEQAVMLPALILLYDLLMLEGPWRDFVATPKIRKTRNLKEWCGKIPALIRGGLVRYGGYVLVFAGFLFMRLMGTESLEALMRYKTAFLNNPLVDADWYSRVLTAAKIGGKYLWLCIWPASLSADYSYNAIPVARSVFEPGVLFGLLTWGGLIGLGVWLWSKDRRFSLCVGFVVLTFLPTSNLLVLVAIMGERFFYLPSFGLCLLGALAWDRYIRRDEAARGEKKGATADKGGDSKTFSSLGSRQVVGLAIVILACLGFLLRTAARNRDWASTESLFRSALAVVPDSARVHIYFGNAATEKGELDEATKSFDTALRIYPDVVHKGTLFNLQYGKLLLAKGNLIDAARSFERAVAISPRRSLPYYNLGLVYGLLGKTRESEAALRKSLELNAESPDTYNTLSRLYIEIGRFEEAAQFSDEALKRNPDFLWAHFNRGWALEKLGRHQDAIASYQRSLDIDPSLAEAAARIRALQWNIPSQGGPPAR